MNDWSFWTFIATAIYAVVSFFQWRAIKRQADLTQDYIEKTAQAVAAANRNATAAFENAEAAKLGAQASKDMAETAKVNAMATIAALENADRPWLHVGITVLSLENGSDGVRIAVNVRITNMGRSAALRVQISIAAMAHDSVLAPMDEVTRVVNASREAELGDVILPTDYIIRRREVVASSVVDEPGTVPLVIYGGVRYTHGESLPRRQVHTTTFGFVTPNEAGHPLETSPRGFSWAD